MSDQIPVQCTGFKNQIDNLNLQLQTLQEELQRAAPTQKADITKQIRLTQEAIKQATNNLTACISGNAGPVFAIPPATTRPDINPDTSPVTKTKLISLNFLHQKFDEFFNNRTAAPLFKLRLHHHDHLDGIAINNDPPNSDAEFLIIDAVTGYTRISFLDLDRLDYGYYFNDINSTFITVNLDTSQPEPLLLKIAFETGGDTEMPSTDPLSPNMNFIDEFFIQVKFTLSFDAEKGNVDFLGWVKSIQDKSDAEIEGALPQFLNVHIATTSAIDPGGAAQKSMRHKIFNKLRDNRNKLNLQMNSWLLGEDGSYRIIHFANDGQALSITYTVPKNIMDPFPGIPSDWPSVNNPHSNAQLDFAPGVLADIDHIVVLTMENRSFDHMLGYLSLPVTAGGMGRTNVDGLKGGEFNFYNGTHYPSFAFPPSDTLFTPDPGHGFASVFHQINGNKMDGFVKSYAEEASGGNGSRIMGYHTGTNVPVYDALARDFAISHRWFAAHPGPTFCNRFYELTGRLNLTSGLDPSSDSGFSPDKRGFWELSNSSPLTPVFTKTIFDFLSDYQHIDGTLTWNYFEHGYCFLRFFEKYTFDSTNIIDANDPVRGFFANAQRGTLPSVSFIDPHFVELPPNANCDGPPADIKDGQALVRKVVEAVVAGPKWNKTLLIIIYDEHGGFYDHVAPPPAERFSNEPVTTHGIRVPAFIISPWVKAGQVFGHDAPPGSAQSLYFDHASILKTIARRFMSDFPPYMGPRYAAANDLTAVLSNTIRQDQFLPFIPYNLMYNASQKVLDVQGGSTTPGTILWQLDKNGSAAQEFSFEEADNGFVYIRTHEANLYVTVDVPDLVLTTGGAPGSSGTHGIKEDVKYTSRVINVGTKFNPNYQKWKLTPVGISIRDKNLYVISNAFFPDKVLQPVNTTQSGVGVIIGDKAASTAIGIFDKENAWKITSPLINDEVVTQV
jgi:phospholipase C